MLTHYDAPAITCHVSPNGVVGYSRGPRRIDLRRARMLVNATIVAEAQAKLAVSRYVQKRAREMAVLRAARQQQRPAPTRRTVRGICHVNCASAGMLGRAR